MDILQKAESEAVRFGSEPLLILPNNQSVSLAQGYIPSLVTFTFEDKAAKGLRKRGPDTKLERPKYFSALEIVRDNSFVLLTGLAGSGKTTFAKYLCSELVSSEREPSRAVIRNNFGDVEEERWDTLGVHPMYYAVKSCSGFDKRRTLQLVIDGIEKTGDHSTNLLTDLLSLSREHEGLRVLILGDLEALNQRPSHPDIPRFQLLGLLTSQRKSFIDIHLSAQPENENIGLGIAAKNPSIFAMALRTGTAGDLAEATLDRLLSVMTPSAEVVQEITANAFALLTGEKSQQTLKIVSNDQSLLMSSLVQKLLAALHLSRQPPEVVVRLFRQDSFIFYDVLRSILNRLEGSSGFTALIEALLDGVSEGACRGALLVADYCSHDSHRHQSQVKALVLRVVSDGLLSTRERVQAGRILSRLDDPRDLTALADVPGGRFTFGSNSHPNSQPVGTLSIRPFRIGLYSVVNRHYASFVKDTGRPWLSPDGHDADRQNAPATDLTWHDARAYCRWLTVKWRKEGMTDPTQIVRLPTEPEWERAARGEQAESDDADVPVYPWGSRWVEHCANDENAGLNDKCCVGLFPRGRSPYGCHDMAGQVWEWCNTLWGGDMAAPVFTYPWRPDDGREDAGAPESIRRVLRGGCFSSGILKACSTYRGSLEPAGFWRGNGFRIVVSDNNIDTL